MASHTTTGRISAEETSPLLSHDQLPRTTTALDLEHFVPGDKANPRNWPEWKKWLLVAVITPVDLSVSWGASGFSPAERNFAADFGIDGSTATLGLSLYILGLALGPMSLAPLSEFFGRSGIYIGSYGIYLLFLLGTALVQSLTGFFILRFFSGIFAAVTIANFGGTIADLWPHHATGVAMSIYLWAATCGSPSGFFLLSFIADTHGWRSIFWALLGICGAFWLLMVIFLRETRHTTILRRRAKAMLRDQRSDIDNTDPTQIQGLERRSTRELFHVALTRPFRFLATEAIVIFAALYNGLLFGLSFLFNGAFVQVFGKGHNFGTTGVGCAFLGIALGISIGPFTNLWQEKYYQRRIKDKGGVNVNLPEARVQLGMLASIVFPISMFWFAWTTDNSINPLVPIIASAFWGWSFYTLILMTFQYTEDSYRVFSASALAGIGLIRNIAGAAFPLFGKKLFNRLGYEWGASLLGFLAVVLIPIPFILAKYGPSIRRRSPWASEHMSESDVDEAESEH